MKYVNNTEGKMKIYDSVLKKVILLEQGETYIVGKSKPKRNEIVSRPKPQTSNSFRKELRAIKGIGLETVKDILNIYPTKAHLISAIKKGEDLSFRNDISRILKKKYSGDK